MSNTNTPTDHAQVMHSIGQLTGAVQAMHQGLTARIDDIKDDIRRLEQSQGERMTRIEDNLGKRIDAVETAVGKRIDEMGDRITDLENEDKQQSTQIAKLSAMGGGVGGALAAGVVELLKLL